MPRYFPPTSCGLALALAWSAAGLTVAQQPAAPRPTTEQVLTSNAQQGRYTFIVFHKGNDTATQAMTKAVRGALTDYASQATLTHSLVSSPAEKALVDRLGVSRAPMPLCVALAPNGAVTGLFMKAPTAADLSKSFVTPTMSRCMKAMQEGNIVLVCVQQGTDTTEPLAVQEFKADPEFQNRVATVSFDPTDPAETQFLEQLELDAANQEGIATIILAPPGVLVGKYPANALQADMVSELHAAGKCCDDPNCKHHQAAPAKAKSAAKPKASSAHRN